MISPAAPFLTALLLAASQTTLATSVHTPSAADWIALGKQVGGRLFKGDPFASPCFDGNSTVCRAVQAGYLKEGSRSNVSSAYINTQWETCQNDGEQCLLDSTNPKNPSPTLPPHQCRIGSIPDNFIDVRLPQDAVAAFEFSHKTKVPIVIKNTGHDYKGRSSAPNSLGLWTHNLKNMTYNSKFVPERCSKASPAVTIGAGVQWGEVYAFAETQNITLVGGSDLTVGASGGWLQGGGHSMLSNTMGMGVDRVLQYKIVTPDGQFRTVNECQHQDLFFALRGGGGGTFGVVLESTILASPRVTLQAVIVTFPPNATRTHTLWSAMVNNSMQWAKDGWGGLAASNTAVYVNPKLNIDEAARSMAPLIRFGNQTRDEGVEGAITVATFPSWGTFFDVFATANVAAVGSSLALTSRLISKSNFQTAHDRSKLLSALIAADIATPGVIILSTAPSSFRGSGTSITEAWRNSIYHVTLISSWNWNATAAEKHTHYRAASKSIDNLREITPDAAYLNESDVYEPNHEVAFWGANYARLLKIKQKYDPHHLLDCWHCIGWNAKSPRFSCYLPS